jgi:S-adenosyl methyltransferase
MSEGSGPRTSGGREATGLADIDVSVAHPARVYDAWLGGKDHFASDRAAAEQVMAANPGIGPAVRSNRAFLARAVRFLATECGIRQFLDLGTGLPSADNVHEVAQAAAPGTRVVYVDDDPIVLVHARALLTGAPGSVTYLEADLRDVSRILEAAQPTLDLSLPVAVMLLMTLQFVPDDDGPHELVRRYMDALPSGSYLVISHPASDGGTPALVANRATERYNELVSMRMTRRTREQFEAFFEGLEFVDPGVVQMWQWRTDPGGQPPPLISPAYCAVARKP